MARVFQPTSRYGCYVCRQLTASDAVGSDLCLGHQARFSLHLLWLLSRHGRLAMLVQSLGQLYRVIRCPWCWHDAGIGNQFPPPWSSTICAYHEREIRAQHAAHLRARRHTPAAMTPSMDL